jgi:hypothetical protein
MPAMIAVSGVAHKSTVEMKFRVELHCGVAHRSVWLKNAHYP